MGNLAVWVGDDGELEFCVGELVDAASDNSNAEYQETTLSYEWLLDSLLDPFLVSI